MDQERKKYNFSFAYKRNFSTGMPLQFDPRINYYQVLGIKENATASDIKKAFYNQAKTYHPDSLQNDINKKLKEEKFKEISNAYDVLSDKEKKTQYDEYRDEMKNQNQNKNYQAHSSYSYKHDPSGKKQQFYRQQRDQGYRYYQDQYYQSDFNNKSWNYSYGDARSEYQQNFNQKQRGNYSYNQYYQYQEWQEFKKFRERLRKQREQQQKQNSPNYKQTQEEAMRSMFISFIGFSCFTYIIFGLFSSNKPVQNQAQQYRNQTAMQHYVGNEQSDTHIFKPTNYNGKVQSKKNDLPNNIDRAVDYYSQLQGKIPMPKIQVKQPISVFPDPYQRGGTKKPEKTTKTKKKTNKNKQKPENAGEQRVSVKSVPGNQ